MDPDELYRRYQELQAYVGWSEDDRRNIQAMADVLFPSLPSLIDDFYAEIERHPEAAKVITGGREQIQRLKVTLLGWLKELLTGPYDKEYVVRRWKVGWRHVDIGLDQVFTNAALSRLRRGLLRTHEEFWRGDAARAIAVRTSLNTLLDLDLAIIEDAYQAEYTARQQRSERLAAIGQVAGGVAHELRNPLNVVKTSVYYLLNAKNPNPEKTAEHLQRIEKHVVVADNVITALSSFAKMPIPNMKPFSIASCIQETLEFNPIPDNIQVKFDGAASLPAALADQDQIKIVLGNLIRNAREAMAKGGHLSISVTSVADCLEIAVADTGVGIPADHLNRILEPLYSTKARGLGLGLAIARAILDKNKGSLRLTSELGKGSTFTIRLATVPQENPK